ncbi:MAG: hypothetical protein Q9171_000707 [Xanthocarpia ochracea]
MSRSLGFGFRPSVAVSLLLAALITLLLSPIFPGPRGHEHVQHAVRLFRQSPIQERDSKVGVAFGVDEYSHNFTSDQFPLTKRVIDFDRQPVDYVWHPEALSNGWSWRGGIHGAPPEELFSSMERLGIPTDIDSVRSVYLKQDKSFMDSFGHLNTPPTGGLYYNTFIPTGRTIIAEANFSPKFKGQGRTVPPLWRWSDVIWLCWTEEAGFLAPLLRYIFRSNIITPETREIIEYIEVERQDKLHLPWPEHTYDMNSEEGLAVLATGHGQGIAYLIADHSDVLGRKIPVATIFTELPGGVTDDEASSSESDDGFDWGGQTYYYILWELRDSITG